MVMVDGKCLCGGHTSALVCSCGQRFERAQTDELDRLRAIEVAARAFRDAERRAFAARCEWQRLRSVREHVADTEWWQACDRCHDTDTAEWTARRALDAALEAKT